MSNKVMFELKQRLKGGIAYFVIFLILANKSKIVCITMFFTGLLKLENFFKFSLIK